MGKGDVCPESMTNREATTLRPSWKRGGWTDELSQSDCPWTGRTTDRTIDCVTNSAPT